MESNKAGQLLAVLPHSVEKAGVLRMLNTGFFQSYRCSIIDISHGHRL